MADFEPGAAAPVANETPVAPAVEPVQSTDAPEPTAGQEGEVKPEANRESIWTPEQKAKLDKIISKEKAQAYRAAKRDARAELERDHYKGLYEQATAPKQQAQPEGEPKVSQFQDYESYIAALTEYKVEQRMRGVQQQSEAQRQAQSQREHAAQIQTKLSSAQAKYADFNEVALADDVPISEPMAAAISRLKDSGEVAYYLGSNIEEAHRISRLDPVDQVWEIKELERKLSAPPAVTKAPPPIVPTSGQSFVKRNTFDLPWKEFVKKRREEEGRG